MARVFATLKRDNARVVDLDDDESQHQTSSAGTPPMQTQRDETETHEPLLTPNVVAELKAKKEQFEGHFKEELADELPVKKEPGIPQSMFRANTEGNDAKMDDATAATATLCPEHEVFQRLFGERPPACSVFGSDAPH